MSVSDQDPQPRSSNLIRFARITSVFCYGALAGAVVFFCGGMLVLLISLSIVDMINVVPPAVIVYSLIVGVLSVSAACGAIWGALKVRNQILINQCLQKKDVQSGLTARRHEETVVCSSCGSARQGRWCSACGQNDREYRRLLPILSEVVGEMFEADSRGGDPCTLYC